LKIYEKRGFFTLFSFIKYYTTKNYLLRHLSLVFLYNSADGLAILRRQGAVETTNLIPQYPNLSLLSHHIRVHGHHLGPEIHILLLQSFVGGSELVNIERTISVRDGLVIDLECQEPIVVKPLHAKSIIESTALELACLVNELADTECLLVVSPVFKVHIGGISVLLGLTELSLGDVNALDPAQLEMILNQLI